MINIGAKKLVFALRVVSHAVSTRVHHTLFIRLRPART